MSSATEILARVPLPPGLLSPEFSTTNTPTIPSPAPRTLQPSPATPSNHKTSSSTVLPKLPISQLLDTVHTKYEGSYRERLTFSLCSCATLTFATAAIFAIGAGLMPYIYSAYSGNNN